MDCLIGKKGFYADWIIGEITEIIKTIEKRPPGSFGEKKALEHIAEILEKPCDGDVKIEPFEVHPMSFFRWIVIDAVCVFVAIAFLFFMPVVSLVAISFGFWIAAESFYFYRRTTDFIFKKKTSHNLISLRKPKGEVKRRILFNGHPDAAYEWTLNYHFGGSVFIAQTILSTIGPLLLLVTSIAATVMNYVNGFGLLYAPFSLYNSSIKYMVYAQFLFIPTYVIMFFTFNLDLVVDGANDNLTACLLATAIVKSLDDNNIRLENTEVGVLLTGSEEAGLRGAYAFCEQHRGEYDDVPTAVITFDTLHDEKFLYVNERDLNQLVQNDDYCSGLFFQGCKNLGIRCYSANVTMGATDAAAFNQNGIRAASITALDHNLQDYYHTRRDTYDNLNKSCLEKCYAASIEALRLFDEQKPVMSRKERYEQTALYKKKDKTD